jgi:predicted O-linked N-acetylglucosamine transferase (SPINDLY family)
MEPREILNQGLALHQADKLDQAELKYDQVLHQDPDNQDALHFLGLIAHQRGDAARAAELIGRAIQIDEARSTFHYNLGAVHAAMKDYGRAAACYGRALELEPDHFDAAYSLGTVLGQAGKPGEALQALETALGLSPGDAASLTAKSAALETLGRSGEAVAAARLATVADASIPEAWTNLGTALGSSGDLIEAEAAHRRALEVDPGYATGHYNLGNALNDLWRSSEARAAFRHALEIDPDDASARGNHLINLLYDEEASEATLFEEHQKWAPAGNGDAGFEGAPEPERRLRIGYVSPDFRTHSCAYFLAPLFASHDKDRFEIFAYSNNARSDDVTDSLRATVDHWRELANADDQSGAAMVAADNIDILVDLAGYSRGGRLGVFAAKPAPVQISWLGYAATTGLGAMDYRITDAIADPEGAADDLHIETLIRLAGGFHCYEPPAAPEVTPPPVVAGGHITFASFNNPAKINKGVIKVWAAVLDAVPNSRLLLKGRGLDQAPVRSRLLAAFADAGVAEGRIETLAWVPRDQSPLSVYGRADIALDTFPYNGTTTTFEALWMGLPVVTLAGQRHSGRVGASLLAHAKLDLEIPETADGYVQLAKALAGAPERLAAFRSGVRGRLLASPLLNGPGFAAKMEAAYRDVWRRWCRER